MVDTHGSMVGIRRRRAGAVAQPVETARRRLGGPSDDRWPESLGGVPPLTGASSRSAGSIGSAKTRSVAFGHPCKPWLTKSKLASASAA
jgi:hypothetical protein